MEERNRLLQNFDDFSDGRNFKQRRSPRARTDRSADRHLVVGCFNRRELVESR